MSDIGHDTVFTGADGPPSTHFLRMIRLDALQQDRSKDDEWIAQWAAAHLDGPAQLWYEELSQEIQESWRLLRREILIRWPPPNPDVTATPSGAPRPQSPVVASKTATIPTPAAAPPSTQVPVTRALANEKRGRIRAETLSGEVLGFISRIPDSDNDFRVTRPEGDALVVSFTLSDQPHELRINDTEFLGLTLHVDYGEADLTKHEAMHGGLGPVTRTPGSAHYVSTSKFYKGETKGDIWSLLMNGTITMSCHSPRCRYFVEPCISRNGGAITMTTNFKRHQELWKAGGWNVTATAARFVFDPIP